MDMDESDTKDDENLMNENPHQAALYFGRLLSMILLLTVDEINPVKVFCSYGKWWEELFLGDMGLCTQKTVAIITSLTLLCVVIQRRSQLIYYLTKLFFRCTFNNMFFRSITIVGVHNLPKTGPVILTGNHNNQFVDAILLLANCERNISFMIAQKSWDRPFIGSLAKVFHCVPVTRPQDIIFKGKGTVTTDGTSALRGEGTSFMTEVEVGFTLNIDGQETPVKVKSISSETLIMLEANAPASEGQRSYKVTPKVEQSTMYSRVFNGLSKGQCLGIFPEGGSHDRTDLLPLKAGVAIIALDAYRKHHITVPIVPVGLNYFQGHRFGGRVVIEFGPPIVVPEQIYLQHETDRRGATDELLKLVTIGMRSCIVPTMDYQRLQQIYTIRRMYVPDGLKLSAEQTMDLNRRFAVGIQRILDMRQAAIKDEQMGDKEGRDARSPVSPGSPNAESILSPADYCAVDEFKAEVEDYMHTLKRLGLKDHHVRQIGWWGVSDLVGRLIYAILAVGVGIVPQVLFNVPVMFYASRWASKEQGKALKASTVKLEARDVVMSYKVITVLMAIPCLYVFYGLIMVLFFRLAFKTVFFMLFILPFTAFLGTKASEQGVRAFQDIVPLSKRLLPGARKEQDALPARRAALQKKLNLCIRRWGPFLGDLYHMKDVDWGKEMGWFTNTSLRDLDKDSKAGSAPTSPSSAHPTAQAISLANGAAEAAGGQEAK